MSSVQDHVLSAMCRQIGTPRALTVFLLHKHAEWDQLVSLECDPAHYFDADSYRNDVAVTDFLRKADFLPTTFDRRAAAVENFWTAEKQCCATALRLFPLHHNMLSEHVSEAHYAFLRILRKKVKWLMGPAPAIDSLIGRFGPGSSYADKGDRNLVPDKLSSVPTLTTGAARFLSPWFETHWGRNIRAFDRLYLFDPVRGNRFTTVPKDAKKDRGIAVEPSINGFYQLGLGRCIRMRLKHLGLDLERAQTVHRQLACEASSKGHLCTVDLSNASDTISHSFVKLVVPEDWFELLAACRSPFTCLNKKWVRLEKFSSMGNGYTFELETVLFLALALSCMEIGKIHYEIGVNVTAYGDDIIAPSEVSRLLIASLKFFGFTPNMKKTFTTGPFRESCGGDFFNGSYVRPFFLKELPDEPQKIISMANGIRRLATQDGRFDRLDPHYIHCWFRCLDAIPSHLRLYGPIELGDLVVHEDRSRWKMKTRNSIHYVRVYRPARFKKIPYERWDADTVYACATYGSESGSQSRSVTYKGDKSLLTPQGVIPRDSVLGYKVGWVPFS